MSPAADQVFKRRRPRKHHPPDAVEGDDGPHVLRQLLRLRPLEVVDDWNDVALGLQSRTNLLKTETEGIMSGSEMVLNVQTITLLLTA